ncbi:protein Mis18-alpha isoform X2 [Hypanus sabinus]|uniref:protein Mis18-alpha isoform X2 n=1 Tax=Hypanus sabinus TaxID=79690 RepID=UPI0028C3E0B9|nr:protein Mis18-alpha isoform X2 [Hypanus sabinus]
MAGVTVDLITDDEEETTRNSATFINGDSDLPVVFLCSQCRLPVGDSLAWAGANPKENMIYLKSVTNNILVDKEQKVDTADESGCGCSLSLGRMYLSTPAHLDFKRNIYCLAVAYIESYVLGSTTKAELVDDSKKPVVLETQAEVLGELAKAQLGFRVMDNRVTIYHRQILLQYRDRPKPNLHENLLVRLCDLGLLRESGLQSSESPDAGGRR